MNISHAEITEWDNDKLHFYWLEDSTNSEVPIISQLLHEAMDVRKVNLKK